MAKIIKEQSTLQGQAQKQWIFLGVIWAITLISFFLPSVIKGTLGIFIVPIIALSIASQLTWKSLIIIQGNIGERRVFNILKQLPDNYYVLNDVTIKVNEKEAQIDHLLVSPYGVWSVETKSHLGKIYGKEDDKSWTQKKKSEKNKIYTSTFYNPVTQNLVHCKRLDSFLNQKIGFNIPIKSVIVFTSADQLNVQTKTPVITLKQLKQVIQSSDMQKILNEATVKKIIEFVA